MHLSIGNAPCSWGGEFAQDPATPPWRRVLDEAREAGYRGIELGPVGFMPEDPAVLGPALAERGLSLIGGGDFRWSAAWFFSPSTIPTNGMSFSTRRAAPASHSPPMVPAASC